MCRRSRNGGVGVGAGSRIIVLGTVRQRWPEAEPRNVGQDDDVSAVVLTCSLQCFCEVLHSAV